MKNARTPRTLAECEFTTGYAGVEHAHHRSHRAGDVVLYLLFVGFLAAVGWGWL